MASASLLTKPIDLNSITDKNDLSRVIDEATPLTDTTSHAFVSSALLIGELQIVSDSEAPLSRLVPGDLLILPPGVSDLQDKAIGRALYDLVIASEDAAVSLSCSSILAGQGNESDDTGDVAVWLGDGEYGPGHASDVLKRLGLSGWAESGQLKELDLTVHNALPPTIKGSTPELDQLSSLLSALEDKHCFRVSSPTTGGLVAFFLIGRFTQNGEWGGLIGLGTWSDN
ncbi:hypothetical protein AX16_007003 [Volvariella volvacea WC 439]|nr:hypothetical protein AX16_007003 [Volvariella volvacea WC 439]